MDRKVMIVDDDKDFLEELNETLKMSGYDMVAVNDASLALEVANSTKPDVILLDLKMPKKSGLQLADELRHIAGLSHIPIIAITGYYKDEHAPLMKMCGIKKYLKKPFYPLDIITQIEAVFIPARSKFKD